MENPALMPNRDFTKTSQHSSNSSLREQALGHLFLGELLAWMWSKGVHDVEVLKSEVDRGGYDVVLESNGITRHVQLKSSFRGSKVAKVDISTKLVRKPGGCVIWIEFDQASLALERFYWFGGEPGAALPNLGSRISRHSKANSQGKKTERRVHRVLSKARFDSLGNIGEVALRLFG